jgi:hypothetical protein
MVLEAVKSGLAQGSVMFITPKDQKDPYFRAVQAEYRGFETKTAPIRKKY